MLFTVFWVLGKTFHAQHFDNNELTPKHDIKWLVSLVDVPRNCRLCSVVADIEHHVARPDCNWVVCPAETFVGVRAYRLYFCQIICKHWNERKKSLSNKFLNRNLSFIPSTNNQKVLDISKRLLFQSKPPLIESWLDEKVISYCKD